MIRRLPAGKAWAGRWHPELQTASVEAYPGGGFWGTIRQRISRGDEFRRVSLDHAKWLATAVACDLQKREGGLGDLFFSYDTTFLEPAELARRLGTPAVLGQVDPGRLEAELVREEALRWKGWEPVWEGGTAMNDYFDRQEAEWNVADRIVVNSQWSKELLVKQGVPPDRLTVIPLAFEPTNSKPNQPTAKSSAPLRVLWLGVVTLRKGFPYFLEAARRVPRAVAEFRVVGRIDVSEEAFRDLPAHVEIVGSVPREEVEEHYAWADIFAFPTLSDGFGMTQLEAMDAGLPVISTPCCGEVVVDGECGLRIPPRNGEALAEGVIRLSDDRNLLAQLQEGAKKRVSAFRLDALGEGLKLLEGDIFS
ncbi:MAG: glycosyltransferase family 4 protein [Verrucomicrobiota bacterium]